MSFLADMWHQQNLSQAFAHAEMRIHLLKIIFELYHDEPDFDFQAANEIFNSAKADLDTFIRAKKRGTPEENRKKLDYFEFWLKLLVFDYGSFVPQAAFRAATSYNTGLQITAYHKQIMTTKPEYVAAAFKVIHGASVESTATKYGLTQHETRQNTLMIGQALYRIGFICDEYNTIKAADTIIQLRTPEYQKLADLDELLHMATNARKLHCQPFERKYCLTQVDWQDYDKSVLAGMWAIGELLKPTKHFQAV